MLALSPCLPVYLWTVVSEAAPLWGQETTDDHNAPLESIMVLTMERIGAHEVKGKECRR